MGDGLGGPSGSRFSLVGLKLEFHGTRFNEDVTRKTVPWNLRLRTIFFWGKWGGTM